MTSRDSDHAMPDAHNGDDAATRPTPSKPASDRQIGPYHLLESLGEGGMGEVYLAEQKTPIKRRVALKLIKLGMDSKAVIARFEAERQALAIMDHPAVAKVFGAGTTPQGGPYFVMEYVKGVPITEYCDRHRLTTRERLDLFREVCAGVQHAHQKAIIHRDLKPSNVLVTEQDGKRLPKIIDFGVAKATAQKLTEKTLFTELGILIGTPEYMSPEQADLTGEDVDTRTDVYSLGVMLYELLSGVLPFDPRELRQAGIEGIRRKIREEEPKRPSTRISTLGEASTESAKRRGVTLPTLQRQLRGDLDWIVMKALEKDRVRRYGSPSEIAADIGRYLAEEPVLASPPSAMYRAKKFSRRHRFGVTAAVVGVLALIGFGAAMGLQANRIASQRDRAEQALADLESVAEFQAEMLLGMDTQGVGKRLLADLGERMAAVRRSQGQSEAEVAAAVAAFEESLEGLNATDVALRLIDEEILARALDTVEDQFADQPLVDARLRRTIGRTYWALGLYDQAEPALEAATATWKRELGTDNMETLHSMNILAILYINQGRYAEAEKLQIETIEGQKRVLGADDPQTLASMNNLANLYSDLGRYAESEVLAVAALEAHKRVRGPEDKRTLSYMNNLAGLYTDTGRYDEAEPLLVEALEIQKRVLGADHPETLASINNLANLYSWQGRNAEAESLYVETLEIARRIYGAEHPATLGFMNNLARQYAGEGRFAEAEPLYVEALEAQERILGADHVATLRSVSNLAVLYHQQGRLAEAESLYVESLEIQRQVLGTDHPVTLGSMNNLAFLCSGKGRFAEAEALHLEIFESHTRMLGPDHPGTLGSLYNLVCNSALRGDKAKAMDRLGELVDAGYGEWEWMSKDTDLEILHGPAFDVLIERARRNATAEPVD